MFIIFLLFFGLMVGSFLNVVILRLNTGSSFLSGRSRCASCAKTLAWYELFPVASFIFLRGKCRSCKTAISSQYIVVELGTAFLFTLFGFFDTQSFSLISAEVIGLLLFHLAIGSVLIMIFVYDLRHMIIPDKLSLILIVFSLSLLAFEITFYGKDMAYAYSHILSSLILSGFLWILWKISDGKWMGLGDAKLLVGLGLLTTVAEGLSGLAFAFWIGALVSLVHLFSERLRGGAKKITMKSEIPFAPFLIIGIILAMFLKSDIFSLSTLFS